VDTYRPETKGEDFEGFETWINAFKMKCKMHSRLLLILFLLHIVIFALSLNYTSTYDTTVAAKWAIANTFQKLSYPHFKMKFPNPDGTIVSSNAGIIASDPWIRSCAKKELSRIKWNHFKIVIALLLVYPFLIMHFKIRSKKQSNRRYIRGSRIVTREEYLNQVKKRNERVDLPFGSVRMPVSAEPKQTFIIGKPGKGKTVLLSGVLERLKERQEKAIAYDFKGDYVSKFYDPEVDLIFNPLDARSLGWRVMNELETHMDIDAVSASLVPPAPHNSNPYWNDAARDVFAGILHYLFQEGFTHNKEIWNMVTSETGHIVSCLKETAGGARGLKHIEDIDSKTTSGILSVLMQYAKCFEYMSNNDGNFRIKEWLNNSKGMIFISNYADVQETLRPILSLFIDLLARRLLSLPDNPEFKTFFLLDEFGTLQRLPTIIKLLTLSRSKGGCVFLGIQDFGQIDDIYNKENRQTIINSCSNTVAFSLSGDAANIAANAIGPVEYIEINKVKSMGVSDYRDGISLNEQKRKELLFLPSDLSNLKDLRGIVRFANYDYILSDWNYKEYEPRNEPLVLRKDLFLRSAEDQKI
jgi:hypothetical protein